MKTEVISLKTMCAILEAATITNTIDQGLLLSHTIQHPTLGLCQTIQADSACLLISRL
ncbi:hypothetical protein [Methylobacter sp. S3L5C]|uniref:hypothetical protein n=1 Tax=Methylobacter sp. S3L5C TaxID=2839024 RepID=UPI001FABF7B6|nr:hypothetical protein [Methylobacter sp. S3L5C]UOA09187.1 hypothetical protein KKZ03_02390 [Methylobacter sp. S3L5C]